MNIKVILLLIFGLASVAFCTLTVMFYRQACAPAILPVSHRKRVSTIHRLTICSSLAGACLIAIVFIIGLALGPN